MFEAVDTSPKASSNFASNLSAAGLAGLPGLAGRNAMGDDVCAPPEDSHAGTGAMVAVAAVSVAVASWYVASSSNGLAAIGLMSLPAAEFLSQRRRRRADEKKMKETETERERLREGG